MWLTLILIFCAQIVYVTMLTLRWILLIRGARYVAAGISVIETLIYVYTLGVVVTQLDNSWNVVVYALGFAAGSLVGTWLEGKIAYGLSTIQVIVDEGSPLADKLREHGFAVTTWSAKGRDAERAVLMVFLPRRLRGHLLRLIDAIEPQAVILDIEPRAVKRGFFVRRVQL